MLPRRRRRRRWHRCIVGVEGGDALAIVVVICPACIPVVVVVVVVVVKVTSRCLGCLAGLDFFGGDELGLLDDPFSVVLGYGGVAVDDFAECFEGGSLVLGEGLLSARKALRSLVVDFAAVAAPKRAVMARLWMFMVR